MARLINGVLYVGCSQTIANVNPADGRVARKQSIDIYGVTNISAAGNRAIVVEGWNDGAALRNDMAILDKNALAPIFRGDMTDSTFLGVIGNRAYIDDWCCFGRANQYRPATVYSISLTGSASKPVDLYPDADLLPRTHAAAGARRAQLSSRDVILRRNAKLYVSLRHHGPQPTAVAPANSPVNPFTLTSPRKPAIQKV